MWNNEQKDLKHKRKKLRIESKGNNEQKDLKHKRKKLRIESKGREEWGLKICKI
jgi:adenylate cyclase class IV